MPATRHAFGGNKRLFIRMVYGLVLGLARNRAAAAAPPPAGLAASVAWRVSIDSFSEKTFQDACGDGLRLVHNGTIQETIYIKGDVRTADGEVVTSWALFLQVQEACMMEGPVGPELQLPPLISDDLDKHLLRNLFICDF